MPSTMPVPTKPRPYRRFANSALHRNFVYCVALTFAWHLMLQGVTGDWYTSVRACFWAFCPLGPATYKVVLFEITSILLFFHQIGTLNVGKRTSASRWQILYESATRSSTYFAFVWYIASALWFSEIFAFTAPSSLELHWTINGGYGASDKLNERPIYLRTIFILLATIHAMLHNYYDLSSLTLNKGKDMGITDANSITAQITMKVQQSLKRAALYSAAANLAAPFLYHGIFRKTFWSWHITWARLFANIPKSEQNPPTSLFVGSIMGYGFVLGMALSLTWQFNVILFQSYMLQAPLKAGMPLSASSKDPNGTLLNGLSAKSQLVKTLAFWELDIIANTFPDRRRNIFGDFERPSQGPMLSSIISAAIGVVRAISERIDEMEHPESTKPTVLPNVDPANDPSIQRLPRILPNSTSAKAMIYQDQNASGNGFVGRATNLVSKEARILGSAQKPLSPDKFRQIAHQLTPDTQKYIQEVRQQAGQLPVTRYLNSSPTSILNSAILGTPVANLDLIVYAVNSSTALLVSSLTEDAFGKAVQCVPSTIQTFAGAVFAIENFTQKHSIGGYVSPTAAAELQDILRVHQTLKGATKELLDRFQLFLNDVGLSIHDLNETRKAVGDHALFTIITNDPAAGSHSSLAPSVREMEEPARRGVSGFSKKDQPVRRRELVQAEDTTNSRPGRLFKQLDNDSAYQNTLRRRNDSTRHHGNEEKNPLASRSAMVDNVLGAKDLGGLQSRKTGRVR